MFRHLSIWLAFATSAASGLQAKEPLTASETHEQRLIEIARAAERKDAHQSPLNTFELWQVERICVRLMGLRDDRSQTLRNELLPFVRDETEFKSRLIVCSGACSDEIHLRGGLQLLIESPGYVGNKVPRIDSASIHRESKPIRKADGSLKMGQEIFAVRLDEENKESVYVSTSRKDFLSRSSSAIH